MLQISPLLAASLHRKATEQALCRVIVVIYTLIWQDHDKVAHTLFLRLSMWIQIGQSFLFENCYIMEHKEHGFQLLF